MPSRIVVFGGDGRDHIKVHNSVGQIPAELFGGSGNDRLRGGNGHDVLVGGEGDDRLYGTDGRDLMIGGLGADQIFGDDDDDILIGGVYIDAMNRQAIKSRHFGVDPNRS